MIRALLSLCLCLPAAADPWTPLLDKDLSRWEIFMGVPHRTLDIPGVPKSTSKDCRKGTPVGLNKDPLGVFKMIEQEGEPVLHISGQMYAGLSTKERFGNYHLEWQFKWGEKKWEPRLEDLRDSGMLIHAQPPHGRFWDVWMRSLECQIQETDCGDFIPLAGARADIPSRKPDKGGRWDYDPKAPLKKEAGYTSHGPSKEAPHGEWNAMEVFAVGDKVVFTVNGTPNMVLFNARQPAKEKGEFEPLTEGHIQLQSEAAEIFFRRIRIRPITEFPDHLAEWIQAPEAPTESDH